MINEYCIAYNTVIYLSGMVKWYNCKSLKQCILENHRIIKLTTDNGKN